MKTKTFVIIFTVMLFILSITVLYMFVQKNTSDTVIIKSDSKVIKTINLSTVSSPYTIVIEYEGRKNTVLIEKNSIRVTSADCPDKVCVNHGELKNSFSPIVCLPNRLTITYADKNSEVDIVAK